MTRAAVVVVVAALAAAGCSSKSAQRDAGVVATPAPQAVPADAAAPATGDAAPAGASRAAPVPAAAVASADREVVPTAYGSVRGVAANGVRGFLNIPYAAPPVGDRRWREPSPPAAWEGTRDGSRFGPACPTDPQDPLNARGVGAKPDLPQSEDCLQLNVWTPTNRSAPLPVMVWIHGGGLSIGSAVMPVYNGANLSRLGVVVVTINYRLGVLGFLAHAKLTEENPNSTSGNWAFYDQILALKWVQQNIREFGGDPANVTIFGESAGAVSVTTLMALPAAKGLFHRAVAQSGSPAAQLPQRGPALQPGTAEYRGEQFARRLGATTLAQMRARSYQDVLTAWRESNADNTGMPGDSSKVLVSIDGHLITEPPAQAFFAGRQARVPFVAGSMADDGSLWAKPIYDGGVNTVEAYDRYINQTYGLRAEQVRRLYPVVADGEVWDALVDLVSDPTFVCPARALARLQSTVAPATHLYQFTRVPQGSNPQLGAFHGLDVAYVFGTVPAAAQDRALSDAVVRAWTRFAATGDPSVATWPRYTKPDDRHAVFDAPLGTGQGLRKPQCDFWIPQT